MASNRQVLQSLMPVCGQAKLCIQAPSANQDPALPGCTARDTRTTHHVQHHLVRCTTQVHGGNPLCVQPTPCFGMSNIPRCHRHQSMPPPRQHQSGRVTQHHPNGMHEACRLLLQACCCSNPCAEHTRTCLKQPYSMIVGILPYENVPHAHRRHGGLVMIYPLPCRCVHQADHPCTHHGLLSLLGCRHVPRAYDLMSVNNIMPA